MIKVLSMWCLLGCQGADGSVTESDTSVDDVRETEGTTDTDAAVTGFFPDGAPWTKDISDASVDGDSDGMISALQEAGWGLGRFQMDWSLDVFEADGATARLDWETNGSHYTPDCDNEPMPTPADAHLEGEEGLACTGGGDCHLLIVERDEGRLYEMFAGDLGDSTPNGGCQAIWDLSVVYPDDGRGDQCTSADAAGYPIAPLLASADEVAAGEVPHALRFILPNASIRDGEFFHPATHAVNAGGGGAEAIPYGARLRLKADFDLATIDDPDARVIAVALQRYGMFLADGGNVTLTVRSDEQMGTTWEQLFEEDGSRALEVLQPSDFEVLELGDPIELTFDCERNGW